VATYWHANYWNANYWNSAFWANVTVVDPQWWADNYWGATYWNANYWAVNNAADQIVAQTAAAQLTLSPKVTGIVLTAEILPNTPTRTLTALTVDAANDVTVSAQLASLTLTAISPSSDAGEYYAGDINFAAYASSTVTYTETVNAALGTRSLTAISPAVTAQTGDNPVIIGSTPGLTLVNPIVITDEIQRNDGLWDISQCVTGDSCTERPDPDGGRNGGKLSGIPGNAGNIVTDSKQQ
jgi:hypothetical protein